jgi:hypothetical protein
MGAVSRNAVVGKAHRLGLGLHGVVHHHSPRPRMRRNRTSKTVHYVDGRVFIVQGEEMIEEQPATFANPLKLMELRDQHCRWPGTGHGIDMLYCAAPVANGYPYCAAHCRIAHQAYMPRPPKAPRL